MIIEARDIFCEMTFRVKKSHTMCSKLKSRLQLLKSPVAANHYSLLSALSTKSLRFTLVIVLC